MGEHTTEELKVLFNRQSKKEANLLKNRFKQHYDGFWEFQKYMDSSEESGYADNQYDVKLIAYAMYLLIWGHTRKMVISMPTRRRKSHAANDAVKYVIGFMPKTSNSRYSYSGELVKQHSKIIRRDIQTKKYKTAFPKIELRADSKSVWEWSVKQSIGDPTFRCAGMDGASTGFGVNKLSIIDDLIKGFKSAYSVTDVASRDDFITGCFNTREESGMVKLYLATRWAENDPSGNILREVETNGYRIFKFDAYYEELNDLNINKFIQSILDSNPSKHDVVYIKIPALNKKEETTCPYDKMRTTEYYKDIRDSELKKGNYHVWYSLFQQEPRPKGAMLFQDFNNYFFYSDLNNLKFTSNIMFLDPAGKGSNETCCPFGRLAGNNLYITDIIYTPEEPKITKPMVVDFVWEYRKYLSMMIGEGNGLGDQYIESINEKLVEKGLELEFDIEITTDNKETKIFLNSDWIKANVWLPAEFDEYGKRQYEIDSPMDRAIKSLTKYVGKVQGFFVKNQEDGFLDSLCGMKRMIAEDSDSFRVGFY